jgi:ribosome biogenesis protein Nip4
MYSEKKKKKTVVFTGKKPVNWENNLILFFLQEKTVNFFKTVFSVKKKQKKCVNFLSKQFFPVKKTGLNWRPS